MKRIIILFALFTSTYGSAQDLKFLLDKGKIQLMKKYDSSAVATSIASKVKYTDTSGMLGPYQTAINTKQNTLVAGTDYLTPTGSAASLTSFPTLNQNTTGSAAALTTGRTISISGDLAYTSPTFNGTSNVSAAGTLATVNSNVGSFGNATQVPSYTVNAKGLITAAANTTIQIPESQVTNLTTDLAAKQGTLTLTTTGTSGAATLVGNTLNIPSYSGGGGGGGTWGSITGTLSSQTDLQSALDAKQNTPTYFNYTTSTYTVTNSGTLTYSTIFTSPTLVAGGVYEIEANLFSSISSNQDTTYIKTNFTGSISDQNGFHRFKQCECTTITEFSQLATASSTLPVYIGVSTLKLPQYIRLVVFVSANGVFTLQASGGTTSGTTYSLFKGSTIKITQLN